MRALFLLLMASCGTNETMMWDGELVPFIREFEKDMAKCGVTAKYNLTSVKFVDKITGSEPGDGQVGLCLVYDSTAMGVFTKDGHKVWQEIEILKTVKDMSENDLKVVIRHESGHCLLNKQHTDDAILGEHIRIMDEFLPLGEGYWTDKRLEEGTKELIGGTCVSQ
jgi:hypothetical protein